MIVGINCNTVRLSTVTRSSREPRSLGPDSLFPCPRPALNLVKLRALDQSNKPGEFRDSRDGLDTDGWTVLLADPLFPSVLTCWLAVRVAVVARYLVDSGQHNINHRRGLYSRNETCCHIRQSCDLKGRQPAQSALDVSDRPVDDLEALPIPRFKCVQPILIAHSALARHKWIESCCPESIIPGGPRPFTICDPPARPPDASR